MDTSVIPIYWNGHPLTLQYDIETPTPGVKPFVAHLGLKLATNETLPPVPAFSKEGPLKLAENEVAVRELRFHRSNSATQVTSWSATRGGFEGNGFGTALFKLSEGVILAIIQKYPQYIIKPVTAIVLDVASSRDPHKKRIGWSGTMAAELGFEHMKTGDEDLWRKQYA